MTHHENENENEHENENETVKSEASRAMQRRDSALDSTAHGSGLGSQSLCGSGGGGEMTWRMEEYEAVRGRVVKSALLFA